MLYLRYDIYIISKHENYAQMEKLRLKEMCLFLMTIVFLIYSSFAFLSLL